MESTQLAIFLKSLSKWPTTELELDTVAEKLAQVLDVPFAAIVSFQSGERVGIKLPGLPLDGSIDENLVRDFVKRKAHASSDPFSIKHIQLRTEGAPKSLSTCTHLAIVSITGELRGEIRASGGPTRQEFGAVVLGSPRVIREPVEIAMLAVSQRLAELAELIHLENVIHLRSQFLSIASHELKTPLTSIYGMLQLQERMIRIKRDESDQAQRDRQESYLKMVIRQVKRLNELIDGLLDISRIQNGRFAVEPTDSDVAAVLKEAVARLQIIAQEAGVSLEVDSAESLHAWIDPVRFEEVITNLVMNGIRFSPEGGVIWIRLTRDGQMIRLSVRDQGPAVSSEDRERIFQPFERAQRTGRLGGLGLGLFISRQIAQLHGGNVSLVESIAGKGNLFEAQFPVRDAALACA